MLLGQFGSVADSPEIHYDMVTTVSFEKSV
jgi:hypothetical protein